MTTNTVDKNSVDSNFLIIAISAGLMLIGIILASSLLRWALDSKLSNVIEQTSTDITSELRERQLSCLSRNIYYEAGTEPFEGKVAVAQVTLNRANNSQFPGDVCKVIYQKNIVYEKVICQFSWACDRVALMRPIHKENYTESEAVAKKVLLEGFALPGLKNALYFHGDYINPGWGKKPIAHIGRHIFYN
jgi:spore germination cell wall hydrolase CwlJ-like protein